MNLLIIPITILLFILAGIVWRVVTDYTNWNKGICPKCKVGRWKLIEISRIPPLEDSYRCNNCGYSTDFSLFAKEDN